MQPFYDVIIIGSGVGGLTAGALTAQRGLSVLVLEKNETVGGYATALVADHFTFEIGAQDITLVGTRGVEVADKLGLSGGYRKITPHCKLIFPDFQFDWTAEAEMKSYLMEGFPGEKAGIKRLFGIMNQVYREIDRYFFSVRSIADLRKFPYLREYSDLSVAQFLDRFIAADKLKALLAATCVFYQGSPPARLSAIHFCGLLMSYFKNGAFHYQGGCAAFAGHLQTLIERNGGLVRTRTEVTRITASEGKATGIVTAAGEVIGGKYIISNMDARATLFGLMDENGWDPVFRLRLQRMIPAHSRCQLFLGVKGTGGDLPFVTFYKEGYDPDAEFTSFMNNRPASFRCLIPSTVDPGMAGEGYQAYTITVPSSYQAWLDFYNQGAETYQTELAKLARHLKDMALKSFPALTDRNIVYQKIISPLDLQRATGNQSGSLYGWEQTPNQSGLKRLLPATPVEGLYLVGQWTIPGGAVCLIMRSADIVARLIAEKEGLRYA